MDDYHDIDQRYESHIKSQICEQNRFIFHYAAHKDHLNLDTAGLYYSELQ